jgi:hypothetical protein
MTDHVEVDNEYQQSPATALLAVGTRATIAASL